MAIAVPFRRGEEGRRPRRGIPERRSVSPRRHQAGDGGWAASLMLDSIKALEDRLRNLSCFLGE